MKRQFSANLSWLMPLSPKEEPNLFSSTLKCLEEQTLKAEELVIVADGILPKTLERVIYESNLPIRIIMHEVSQGIGGALSQAAMQCKGEIIIRIDSDDIYAPEHTKIISDALKNDNNIGVVGCQLLEIDTDNDNKLSTRSTPISPLEAKRWLMWRNPLNHQTVAISHKALIEAGGYRSVEGFEDWDLWIRISSIGYKITNLTSCSAAARVSKLHRQRRRGFKYIQNEINFYLLQIKEKRIPILNGLFACFVRLPWRIMPKFILTWWMQSKLRGSPPFKSSWVTKFLLQEKRLKTIG